MPAAWPAVLNDRMRKIVDPLRPAAAKTVDRPATRVR